MRNEGFETSKVDRVIRVREGVCRSNPRRARKLEILEQLGFPDMLGGDMQLRKFVEANREVSSDWGDRMA